MIVQKNGTSDEIKIIRIKAEKILNNIMKKYKITSVNLPDGTPNMAITIGLMSQYKKNKSTD